jgi:signal transduction histidine kinase
MLRLHRLHTQFYLAILATLAVFLLAGALLWHLTGVGTSRGEMWSVDTAAQLADTLLPPPTASQATQQQVLDSLHRQLGITVALYDLHGQAIGRAGNIPTLQPRDLEQKGWTLSYEHPLLIVPLRDGRHLVVRPQHPPHAPGLRALVLPIALTLAFALGAYPIARRLTRRLAHLQTGVEQLGAGDLSARVRVTGHDEVAALARSFNASAERIEALVNSHRLLLANCSHELRTPLARIRLGLERIVPQSDRALYNELARSIAELDELIGEMLLSSRLDALRTLELSEEIDLLALAAEEASHFDRSVEGTPVIIQGDPSLLRRLVRNLLENAQRHAGGTTRVSVHTNALGEAELSVDDHGVGVAEGEREKIFEPFYRSPTAGAPKGFGLGLALVRRIARAHGGDVRYSPLPEGGSRFTVTVPLPRAD